MRDDAPQQFKKFTDQLYGALASSGYEVPHTWLALSFLDLTKQVGQRKTWATDLGLTLDVPGLERDLENILVIICVTNM